MKKKKIIRRLVSFILCVSMYMAMIPQFDAYALTTKEQLEEAKKKHEETKDKINSGKENVSGLKGERKTLQNELDELTEQMEQISAELEELEKNIADKEEEIVQTEAELAEAKQSEADQYAAMKKRIRFMYEKQDFVLGEILFSSAGFGDMLNKADYIEDMSKYDRKMLEELVATRITIEETGARLEKEKEELDELHEEAVEKKHNIQAYIDNTSSNIREYTGQIKTVEASIAAYEAQAKKEEEDIAALKKKYEEELALSKLAAASKWRDISEVSFEESDRYLLANLIYCEAGNQPYAGQLAVGAVVINRVLSSVYPNTVAGVIYQNKQFSPVGDGHLALALAQNRATEACYKAADEAMSGHTNVGNRVYFRTPIEGLTGMQIGGHIFY